MAHPRSLKILPASCTEAIGLDPRSLTFLRVSLGFTLLLDALARLPNACLHFADSGLISRRLLFENVHYATWNVNVFAAVGACPPTATLFLVYATAAASLIAGYFTRLSTFTCWLFVVSMQHRNPAVHDSGDFYLRVALFWSLFLPLGARGGVDAFLRRSPEHVLAMAHRFSAARAPTAESKGRADERSRAPYPSSLIATAATLALILQVVTLYAASFFEKTGDDWKVTWNATQMSLQLEHFVRPAGRILRRFPLLCKGLTALTLLAEGPLSPLLLLGSPPLKCAVALLFVTFHLGLGLTMHLGHFPWHCIAVLTVFVPTPVWDALERRLASSSSRAGLRLWLAPHVRPSSLAARALDAVAVHCMLGSSWATARAVSVWEVSDAHPAARAFAALPRRRVPACLVETPGGTFLRGWPAFRAVLAASPLMWPLATLVPASWGNAAAVEAAETDAEAHEYAASARAARNDLLSLAASAAMELPAGDARQRMLSDLIAAATHQEATQLARGAGRGARDLAPVAAAAAIEPLILPVVERATRWHAAHLWARHLRRATLSVAVTVALVWVQLHNARTIMLERPVYGLEEWAPGKPPGLTPLMGQLARVSQRWDMFAPFPLRWDPWIVVPATLTDGREVDLWPSMPHHSDPVPLRLAPNVSFAHPGPIVYRTGSKQWHRYWHTMWKKRRSWMRKGLARWVCRRFKEVKYLRIVAMAPYNLRPGARTKPYKVSLWSHYCREEYREEHKEARAQEDGDFILGGMPKVKADAPADETWGLD